MLKILTAVGIFAVLGAAIGILLAVASKVFEVKNDEKVEKIKELLPGANCGGCGFAGCSGLADAIVKGTATPSFCSSLSGKSAEEIDAIVGTKTMKRRMRAQVMCSGFGECAAYKFEYVGAVDCRAAAALSGGEKTCEFGCLGFGNCVSACSYGAISVEDGVAKIDYMKCRGCGACINACPRGIIELIPYNTRHWIGCKSKASGVETKKACTSGCIGCKICEKNCPKDAVKVVDGLAAIDYAKCNDCDICPSKCPQKIIWSAVAHGSDGLAITKL